METVKDKRQRDFENKFVKFDDGNEKFLPFTNICFEFYDTKLEGCGMKQNL